MIYKLKFDHYICVSQATQRDLVKRVPSNKTSVIYNGIDYDFFDPDKYDANRKKLALGKEFVYLTYGRPGPSKGIEYVVRAVPDIVKEVPDSKLLLVLSKDKAYRKRYDEIIRLISSLGVAAHVVVCDPVPWEELPAVIKAVDCVVVPSLAEGFGFTAAESCAMGKTVVASRAGSLPEVVSGEFVLVPARDAGAIARAVVEVAGGKVKKGPIKRFPWQENVEKTVELYNKLLS
jgi:glycosyltransferase involved in cell wall biosynthesis